MSYQNRRAALAACGKPMTGVLLSVLQMCEEINTPRSLCVSLLILGGEWDQLVSLDIDPSVYEDHSVFADDYLVTKILSKCPELPTSFDRKAVAVASFFEAESLCLETNRQLFSSNDGAINLVAHQIQRIVGPLDVRDLREIEENFRHGPGAAVGLKGSGSSRSDKFRTNQPTCTHKMIPFIKAIVPETWATCHRYYEVVEGNTFTTVPKNAKTDRGICIEPLLNLYVQLGIGAVLKQKLKRAGNDVSDPERNRALVARAQKDGLATIDLSMASDTVSFSCIYRLLPPRWFELLDMTRSENTVLPDGTVVHNEKFSSMGNGYTFELESLVFLGIVRSCVPQRYHHQCSVFGDDIICPQQYATDVVARLEAFGFKPNWSKSYLAGRFFESCGRDYFDGVPVRPPHIGGAKSEAVQAPMALGVANRLRHYAFMRGDNLCCDSRFRSSWQILVSHLPNDIRNLTVPIGAGDVGLEVDISEIANPQYSQDGWERVVKVRCLRAQAVTNTHNDYPALLNALCSRSQFSKGVEPLRGLFRRVRIRKQWLSYCVGYTWG